MKILLLTISLIAVSSSSLLAVGSMGVLFRSCWKCIALEKALASECQKDSDSGACYNARQVVVQDLQVLVDLCKDFKESTEAQQALIQAEHDLDMVKKQSSDYKFALTLHGGPMWSSGDPAFDPKHLGN